MKRPAVRWTAALTLAVLGILLWWTTPLPIDLFETTVLAAVFLTVALYLVWPSLIEG